MFFSVEYKRTEQTEGLLHRSLYVEMKSGLNPTGLTISVKVVISVTWLDWTSQSTKKTCIKALLCSSRNKPLFDQLSHWLSSNTD